MNKWSQNKLWRDNKYQHEYNQGVRNCALFKNGWMNILVNKYWDKWWIYLSWHRMKMESMYLESFPHAAVEVLFLFLPFSLPTHPKPPFHHSLFHPDLAIIHHMFIVQKMTFWNQILDFFSHKFDFFVAHFGINTTEIFLNWLENIYFFKISQFPGKNKPLWYFVLFFLWAVTYSQQPSYLCAPMTC